MIKPDDGEPMPKRWTAWQKAAVIRAIRAGTLSAAEARDRYMVSEEELSEWLSSFERDGLAGLQMKSLSRRRRRAR